MGATGPAASGASAATGAAAGGAAAGGASPAGSRPAPSSSTAEIQAMSAAALSSALRSRAISAREALAAHLAQIEAVNPQINAVITLDPEGALALAAAADQRAAAAGRQGEELPLLHGLPMTHKDTHNTKGLRTTQGSVLFQDFVPDADDLVIARLKAAGVLTTGKSNVPEFAAGSHTFNEVFGTTTNPYAPDRSAGGSSGGAAAALAARIQPISDGSDMGGSLRIPASFCNVVGFRPSAGTVPAWPTKDLWSWLGRSGPMAREVADIALMLQAIAGPVPGSLAGLVSGSGAGSRPASRAGYPSIGPEVFAQPLERDLTGLRVAWTPDFGLGIPVEKEVLRVLEAQLAVFAELGADVTQACPDLRDADLVFRNTRSLEFVQNLGDLVRQHPESIKPEVRWNVEQGWALTGQDVADTAAARTRLELKVQEFFGGYNVLLAPAAQVLPFDAAQRFPASINGEELPTYLDWMRSACVISATGLPALSMPAGFSASGLPVGLQMVMNHGEDFELLQVAHAFEQATGYARRVPDLAQL
ncbi:amidase [Arthrobacter luteolus]|uniref:amidase n=1 Tax=Arthrobacter luteolus TaxID=98672 RepID=UPI0009F86D5B|nr:amidase [Arthrobacter luteolus]